MYPNSLPQSKWILFALLLIISSTGLHAQNVAWYKVAQGLSTDVAEDVTVSSSGHIYVAARVSGTLTIADTTVTATGVADLLILKYDTLGNLIWAKTDGGPSEDYAVEIGVDSLDNIYLGGRYIDTTVIGGVTLGAKGEADIFVAKYDKDGNFIWVKSFGGNKDDRLRGLATAPDGTTYIAGRYRNSIRFTSTIKLSGNGADDIYMAKISASGNVKWARSMGGSTSDFGEAVTFDKLGNVFTTGSFFDTMCVMASATVDSFIIDTSIISTGDEETFITKHDKDGNLIWAKRMGSPVRDYGEDMSTDEMGNVYLTGSFAGTADFGNSVITSFGDQDFFIAKFDPDGRSIWANHGGSSSNNDAGWGTAYDGKGNIFLTGFFRGTLKFSGFTIPASESYNWFITKINAGGFPVWVDKIGDPQSYDLGRGVAVDASGNAYTVGVIQDTIYIGDDTLNLDTIIVQGTSDFMIFKYNTGPDNCGIADATFNPSACDPLTNLYSVDATVTYYNAPDSGELSINGFTFPITSSPQTVTIPGLISSGLTVNAQVKFTTEPLCVLNVFNAFQAPDFCAVCNISDITIDTIGPCKPSTNRHFVSLTVTYSEPPATGTLVINGQDFVPTSSPQSLTLFQQWSDGLTHPITAYFSEDFSCSYVDTIGWQSPDSCSSCSVNAILVDSVYECDPISNTYSADIMVNFTAYAPGSLLDINGQLFEPGFSPGTYTLTGLVSDGLPVDLLIKMTTDTSCMLSVPAAFTAPMACDTCPMFTITVDSTTACDSLTNTYSAFISVAYTNAPDSGLLSVNGQTDTVSVSPQVFQFDSLPSNGNGFAVTAFFSERPSCIYTDNNLFTAPSSCINCPEPVNLTVEFDTTVAGKSRLKWDAVTEADSYILKGQRINASHLSIISVPSNHRSVSGLNPGKTYVWWLYSVCGIDTSASSVVDTFTQPILRDLLFEQESAADLYPNPAANSVLVRYQATGDTELHISIYDEMGRLVISELEYAFKGTNAFNYNIGDLDQGLYLIKVQDGTRQQLLRLVVSR